MAREIATFTKTFIADTLAWNIIPDIQPIINDLRNLILSPILDNKEELNDEEKAELEKLFVDAGIYLKNIMADSHYTNGQISIPGDEEMRSTSMGAICFICLLS